MRPFSALWLSVLNLRTILFLHLSRVLSKVLLILLTRKKDRLGPTVNHSLLRIICFVPYTVLGYRSSGLIFLLR